MLEEERQNIAELRSRIDDIPAEALQEIGESLAEIMLVKDTSLWTQQYRNTHIDHL